MNDYFLNQTLRKLYLDRLPTINSIIHANIGDIDFTKISGPFMMHVYPEYTQASKKILFVGMETHTWEPIKFDEDIEYTYKRLTERYFKFISGEEHPNSPFWWFIRKLSYEYRIQNYAKSVLWTNLSKIDVQGKRPTGVLYDNSMQTFMSLLTDEISVVKPDIVVMMTTDPNYVWHINKQYGLKFETDYREEKIANRLFKIKSPMLPSSTYQICHPNRLRFMSGGFTKNANDIIQIITNEVL